MGRSRPAGLPAGALREGGRWMCGARGCDGTLRRSATGLWKCYGYSSRCNPGRQRAQLEGTKSDRQAARRREALRNLTVRIACGDDDAMVGQQIAADRLGDDAPPPGRARRLVHAGSCALAERGGRNVGSLLARLVGYSVTHVLSARVRALLNVRPSRRLFFIEALAAARLHGRSIRGGVGKKLLDWALTRARASGAAGLYLRVLRDKEDAQRLYGREGYSVLARVDEEDDRDPYFTMWRA
eukprot:gene7329-1879_t